MWLSGLGLLLWNGTTGLLYYSSKAGRVLVANGGIVATVAVSGYLFPRSTAAGLAGAVAIRGATWVTKKVDKDHHVHIANGVDTLLEALPRSVAGGFMRTAHNTGKPQRKVSTTIANHPQLTWVNESLATELVSPLLEETIYRAGIQQGLLLGLTAVGVPRPAALLLAGAISSTLFAGAHSGDPSSPQYRDTLVSGIGFGLMMYTYGLPAAVVSHSANNTGVRLEEALGS